MRIEEITKAKLEKVSDTELARLRYKAATYWDRHFKSNDRQTVGCFTRTGFIAKYRLLLNEVSSERRSLQGSTSDLDRQAFRQSMQAKADGIDLAMFQEVPTTKNCVILDKDFAKADEINITIQAAEDTATALFLEEELTKAFAEQFDKPVVFNHDEQYEGEGIPLFDQVMRPAAKVEAVEIKKEHKEIEEDLELLPVEKEKDERIVCGIVYEPNSVDSQGDQASADEIKKAAYGFMEHAQAFKVMHKGKKVNVRILENYIAPVAFKIGDRQVKKGSWVMVARVVDKKLWKAIKGGELTGYSMAGYAKVS
jgi:hypothetical protein